jgi:hypothetical protein
MAEPTLTISSRSVGFIIVKAREVDDLARKELVPFIAALGEEQQTDLVALMWLGRGDGTLDEWADLRDEVRKQRGDRTAARLLSEPLLSDHLEEGLSQFGFTCAEFEIAHL